ncbi:uncharacterized protein LOC122869988 [Siniperca chuatsi]|uniref:uncharacterized protein LOC122869988 n=1 Tax=Siniperca chuatsi TaxID=119488 RepID=UPI001CE0B249|nr:uncharacterized protein LOC122869988 [Siniperca chuatsi]
MSGTPQQCLCLVSHSLTFRAQRCPEAAGQRDPAAVCLCHPLLLPPLLDLHLGLLVVSTTSRKTRKTNTCRKKKRKTEEEKKKEKKEKEEEKKTTKKEPEKKGPRGDAGSCPKTAKSYGTLWHFSTANGDTQATRRPPPPHHPHPPQPPLPYCPMWGCSSWPASTGSRSRPRPACGTQRADGPCSVPPCLSRSFTPTPHCCDLTTARPEPPDTPGTSWQWSGSCVTCCCPFRQYMPSKQAKYGINPGWAATPGRCRSTIYTGKPAAGGALAAAPERNQGMRVVLDLTEDLRVPPTSSDGSSSAGTSPWSARSGKTSPSSRQHCSPTRAGRSSLFTFTGTTALASYVPKKNRHVLPMSTLHVDAAKVSDCSDRKPAVVLHYNRNKGGVDKLDKVVATYSCRRITARWPLVIFHNMLNVSTYNAFMIWRELNPGWLSGKR